MARVPGVATARASSVLTGSETGLTRRTMPGMAEARQQAVAALSAAGSICNGRDPSNTRAADKKKNSLNKRISRQLWRLFKKRGRNPCDRIRAFNPDSTGGRETEGHYLMS